MARAWPVALGAVLLAGGLPGVTAAQQPRRLYPNALRGQPPRMEPEAVRGSER